MPVNTTHPDYDRSLRMVRWTRDACAGNDAIKGGIRDTLVPISGSSVSAGYRDTTNAKRYLPAEFSDSSPARYQRYLDRAYFMGVTGRTRDALTGMIFRKPPVYEAPDQIQALFENIDGSGQSLDQIAKTAAADMMETGRYYFLVDFPQSDPDIDAETEARMGMRPVIAPYPFEALINWRFETVGTRQILVMAVLREIVEEPADEFDHTERVRYRVLRLRPGIGYTQQLYSDTGNALDEETVPRMAGGVPFDHIPLHIAGAQSNLPGVETPPLYDLAVVNIAHYRNIADIEESAFTIAQPMLHIDIGETDEALWKSQNGDEVTLGSRHGIITKGGKAEIIQPASDSLLTEIKKDKESEMVMLGARLIQRGGSNETAEASRINASAEASTLDSLVSNLSEAIEAALEDVGLFMGVDPDSIEYALNREFWEPGIDPQTVMAIIQLGKSSVVGPADQLHMIRKGKIELIEGKTDEEILAGVANNLIGDDI